jgi:hypothetical protein
MAAAVTMRLMRAATIATAMIVDEDRFDAVLETSAGRLTALGPFDDAAKSADGVGVKKIEAPLKVALPAFEGDGDAGALDVGSDANNLAALVVDGVEGGVGVGEGGATGGVGSPVGLVEAGFVGDTVVEAGCAG